MRFAFLIATPLIVLGTADAAAPQPEVIAVELSNFKFAPSTIMLDHDRAYILRLHNAAGGAHDFTAREFFAVARIAPKDRQWVKEGEVEVAPGQIREIALTAPTAGRYKLKCTHTFHKALGMSGTIVVR